MKDVINRRERWQLTQSAFDALLDYLAADHEQAGQRFEDLRYRLLQFFGYEACRDPDRWADETLDRLAKRLSEGNSIQDVNAFTRGIAKMVLREARALERRQQELTAIVPSPSSVETERDAACLHRCLDQLSAESRHIVDRYYFQTGSNIGVRKALAQELGVTAEALRSRALRIRRQLERCMEECRDTDSQFSPDSNRSGKT